MSGRISQKITSKKKLFEMDREKQKIRSKRRNEHADAKGKNTFYAFEGKLEWLNRQKDYILPLCAL